MLPATIGPYRMLRRLGQGGMGAVYEAVHETIERRVAIKLLHPEYAQNPDVMARFFNEARAVNRIDHPGLVQVSDYGRLPDGVAYIVMEFLKGESLGSRIRNLDGALPLAQTLQLARQIADALTAAHEKGIVHRDLKPDNVMIVPDAVAPGGERTKLLDFGIAKLAEEAQPGRPRTRVDAVMGTPHYIAPEQCRKANAVDDKADVYSLGVMLYQMLCGRLPFDGEGAGEILAKHLYEQPPAFGRWSGPSPERIRPRWGCQTAKTRTTNTGAGARPAWGCPCC
jgi:serine/threonine-protein kinase